MPASLLFDISGIDLDAIAVPTDEVGRLNPQSGDMRHLDHVIWMADDHSRSLGVKFVRDDEFWVPGHIPGSPLMPGVLMIEAGAQLACIAYRFRTQSSDFVAFTRIEHAAFRSQVVPGDTLYLLAQECKFQARRFICDVQGFVRDQVAFEARIYGMKVGEIRTPEPAGLRESSIV